MAKMRVLQVGSGGFGGRWCQEFLPANISDGLIEVAGLIDTDPRSLRAGQVLLGLPDSRCFVDPSEGFAHTKADFCTVVVPPSSHEEIIRLAIANDMHVLSEKPIADTIDGCVRIVRSVGKAGLKLAITTSHRYDQDKWSLERIVKAGELGVVNSIFCHTSADHRRFASWGGAAFRHTMSDALLIEGGIHQFEILKGLAGARCTQIYANTWRPAWAEYAGDTDCSAVMQFENDVRAIYYGSVSSPVSVPDYWQERIRVEGSDGIASLNHREIELFMRLKSESLGHQVAQEGSGMKVALFPGEKWLNSRMIEDFVRWLDGGPEMETHAEASLETHAMMFAAAESAHSGQVVDMGDFRSRHQIQ